MVILYFMVATLESVKVRDERGKEFIWLYDLSACSIYHLVYTLVYDCVFKHRMDEKKSPAIGRYSTQIPEEKLKIDASVIARHEAICAIQ